MYLNRKSKSTEAAWMMPHMQIWTNVTEFQTTEASRVNHKKQWKVTECLKMPFCLQKQLRKQLTGAVKPGLLLLCHSWGTTIAADTVLSECRDSLDQKSRLPRFLPWQTARSEVKTQSQSLADWQSGTKSQTGQECPRCWPREKATYPSIEGTPELLFLHLCWERPGIPKGTWAQFQSQTMTDN